MKNLFKNLMLVAVAAMAFTACTETNDEVNAVTKKVVLEFVADLADDDTRVAFGEKDGNKYPTVWEAGDNVTVKVGEKQAWYTLTEEDVLESGKKAIIRPEFELVGDETLSGDLVATVNEYVSFDNHQGNEPTISLKAEAVYPATTLTFEHQYAYGKMELVGLPDDFNVTQVKLTLVGGGDELNHTISGYSVEDNIFWFTTEAMEAVESFAVYASNDAETYYREVTVEKAFAFEVGKVSAFRVKDFVVKPADFAVQLTKITSMSNNVIRFEGDNAEDNITISFNPGLETIAAGHYDAVDQDWFNGGEWAWTGATALEVKNDFPGSSVDVNAAGGGAYYYSQNGVDITVDGDVYTIVAHLKNFISGSGNKTVDFTYVGKLEAEESEEPGESAFTSAEYNGITNDKIVKLYSETLGELWMNFYGSNPLLSSDNWINPGQYGKGNGMYFGGNYGQYKPAGSSQFLTGTPNSFTLDVSIVDGKYKFVINADYTNLSAGVVLENATFIGAIPGLDIPDLRTQLAKPSNVTGSADGKTITLSWDAVEGAEGYRVKLYSPYDESFEEIVTTNEYVYEAQSYNKIYQFTIMTYASDTNADYRSSEDAYVDVTTGKDPNSFADVMATDIQWNSSGYFTLTVPDFSYFYLEVNSANRPNNNSLVVGDYTYGQNENQFRVKYQKGYAWNYSDSNGSTMNVSFVDDQYVIVINVTSGWTDAFIGTIGYKGMPEGWVAPGEGGSGDEGGSGGALGTVDNPYTFTTCTISGTQYPILTFSGAEDGATLTLESNTSYGLPTGVVKLGNNGWWSSGHSYSLGEIDPGYSYSSIDQNGDGSYTINYIMIKSGSNTIYYHYSGGSIL